MEAPSNSYQNIIKGSWGFFLPKCAYAPEGLPGVLVAI